MKYAALFREYNSGDAVPASVLADTSILWSSMACTVACASRSAFVGTRWAFGGYYVKSDFYDTIGSPVNTRRGARIMTAADSGLYQADILIGVPHDNALGITPFGLRRMGAFARGSSSGGQPDGYFGLVHQPNIAASSLTLELVRCNVGVATVVATTTIAFPNSALDDYSGALFGDGLWYIRFRVNGTTPNVSLSLKVWQHGNDEPSAWDLTYTDAVGVASTFGYPGVMSDTISGGFDGFAFSFVSLGSNGDSAPMPMTYPDMAEFLNQDTNKRILLMEAEALDGTGAASSTLLTATAPYATMASDVPASQPYDDLLLQVPNYTMRSTELFAGKVSTGFGDAIINNENGERDDWLRYNWDGRPFRLYVGGRGLPRWDFFRVLTATIVEPYTPSPGRLGFKLRDSSVLLDKRLNVGQIGGSGQNAGEYLSFSWGEPFNIPLKLYDYGTLTYVFNDTYAASPTQTPVFSDIRNNGNTITASIAVTAVDTGTEAITVPAHGAVVNNKVTFTAGTPPSPLALNTRYLVASVIDANNITLKNEDGTAINLTTNTTGATCRVQRWIADSGSILVGSRYVWTLKLNTDPGSGQLTADFDGYLEGGALTTKAPNMLAALQDICERAGGELEAETEGTLVSSSLWASSYHSNGEAMGLSVLNELVISHGALCGTNHMGRLYASIIQLPQTDYDFDLLEDDVDRDTFKLERLLLPQEVEQLGYRKNYTVQSSGLATALTPEQVALYGAEATFTAVAEVSSALDSAASHLLAKTPERRITLIDSAADAANEATRIATMRGKSLGVFSLTIRNYQLFMLPGHRVRLTHRRYGFDAGLIGIVVGKVENFKGTTQVQVLFQLDGAWPTGTYPDYTHYYQRSFA